MLFWLNKCIIIIIVTAIYIDRQKDILYYVNGVVYNDSLAVRIISDPNNPSFTYSTTGNVQYGCFALEDIPKNKVLGLFSGILMKEDEINEKIKYVFIINYIYSI